MLADHLLEQLSPDDAAPVRPAKVTHPILDELARLENTLSTGGAEDLDTAAVTARLEKLLARWKAEHAPDEQGGSTERLRTADAGQLLDFIDNELGVQK